MNFETENGWSQKLEGRVARERSGKALIAFQVSMLATH